MLNASLNTTEEITLQSLATAIDSLAISMARGFESIESRMATKEDLGKLEQRLEKRMDSMDECMAMMATKSDLMQLEDRLTLRIVALEQK